MAGLSLWQLSDIRTKVRNLAGRADPNELSETDLDAYINRFYQLRFPLEVRPSELYLWFSFDLTASTEEYDLTTQTDADTSEIFVDGYLTLDKPSTADGYTLNLYVGPGLFYYKWPETTTYAESRPVDVLYYNRKLLFRYPPDDSYTVKFSALKKPSKLSASTDYPMMEEWGPVIAYGTALEILQDVADMERINELMPFYEKHIAELMRKVQAQETNVRSVPTF